MPAAYYDFFRKILLQPDGVTLEADSIEDTLTITRGNGVAFNPNATNDSFEIDVDYQLYVPIGTTNLQLIDVNSNSTSVSVTAGSNIAITRVSDTELIISSTVGGVSKSISNISQSNPAIVTTVNPHEYTDGIAVTITDVGGMTQVNGNEYYMDILTSNTFALYTDSTLASPLNSTGFALYTTGGVATAEYNAPQALTQLNDVDLITSTPVTNDLLQYDGVNWVPLAPDAVEFNKVTTSIIDSNDSSAITFETDVVMNAGLTVGNHIVPSSNENIDLGSATNRFRTLYLSGNTIDLGGALIKKSAGNVVELPAGSTIAGTIIPTTVSAAAVGLGNVTNESKATMFTNPAFTGTVTGVTATHVGLGNVTNESKTTMFTNPSFIQFVTMPTQTEIFYTPLVGATVGHDLSTSSVYYYTPNQNFTANFNAAPTTNNRTISVALILVQGATAYMPTAVQIDNVNQTLFWQGGSAPTGTANGIDVVSFTLIRYANAWEVIGSATGYA